MKIAWNFLLTSTKYPIITRVTIPIPVGWIAQLVEQRSRNPKILSCPLQCQIIDNRHLKIAVYGKRLTSDTDRKRRTETLN